PIYMDYHAPTPMDPRVFEAMKPYFMETFGNAASRNQSFGWEAEEAVEKSRKQIADLIGANTKEIVFTSGATEHKAILDTCKRLEKHGIRVTYLPVQTNGLVDLEMLKQAITDKTILISIMYANNEIGVIQPMAEIGKIAKAKGVLVHSDATQAVGKVPVNVIKDNIDLMSMSGHKIYGPKGVGALYVRRKSPRVQITAQMDGGGHERGMRSGTLNVPGIVGLGEACAICNADMPAESKRMAYLRDKLRGKLESELDEVYINGTM